MAKNFDDNTTETEEHKINLQRVTFGNEPEFKPGDKPYLEYDGQILNANVDWKNIVRDLLKEGYSVTQIAADIDCSIRVINRVLLGDYEGLCFRAGAKMITLHSNGYDFIR